MQAELDDVIINAVSDYYSKSGMKMARLSRSEKLELLHTADPEEAAFLRNLISKSEEEISTRFEQKWSHLFHIPKINLEKLDRLEAQATLQPKSSARMRFLNRIRSQKRKKYNFHERLCPPTNVDCLRMILKDGDSNKKISKNLMARVRKVPNQTVGIFFITPNTHNL